MLTSNTTYITYREPPVFTDYDVYLFKAGKHFRLFDKMGSHPVIHNGISKSYFSVWAPYARSVRVIGDFNAWNGASHQLAKRSDDSGIWEATFPNIKDGNRYKFSINNSVGTTIDKADPFATYSEISPATASVVHPLRYQWKDQDWLEARRTRIDGQEPCSVYEVHLGSWKLKNGNTSYRNLARDLIPYVKEMGFTHVELLPVMEHPFYGSWGYQTTGYFSPTSRYGTPEDLMYLIDQFHQEGIGVILDWSAAHFPGDAHGLHSFDGTHLFEHQDPRQGFHPEWQTYIYNYGRNEVRSFLMSSAMFWLERFHADGLRVDAVASMLYLDYSRKDGQWVANERGGNENLDAVTFLKELNETAYRNFPGVMMIAEDSTTWPNVTRSTSANGLGFGQKWMLGWMHDTLNYFHRPFDERPYHQQDIAFSIGYAFDEHFMLPLSHDEVVHGKGSLIEKMYGTTTQKFANLRCLFSYMFMHPGTKLVFMGSEFAQLKEWDHDDGLQWNLLQSSAHIGIHELIKDLNGVYKTEKALHRFNFNDRGFSWIDCSDRINSVIAFSRNSENKRDSLVVICNFQTRSHQQYQLGVPHAGSWKLIFNSDLEKYGGSSPDVQIVYASSSRQFHGYRNSLTVAIPPLSVLVFKVQADL